MLNQAMTESNSTERARLQHPSDAADLRMHFRGGLRFVYEGAFGQQLERAALYAFGGFTCKACEGTGFVASNVKAWHRVTQREREWLALLIDVDEKTLEPPLADRVCGKCKGMGWIERKRRSSARSPLTVQLKGSSKKGKPAPSVRLNESDLTRVGGMEARLGQLDTWERGVLDDYYSPSGGSVVALFAYTAAGRTLLRRNKLDLPARQFFENEIAAESARSDPRRRDLLAAAEEQAVDVHSRAVASWVATKRRVNAEETRRAALRLLDGGP